MEIRLPNFDQGFESESGQVFYTGVIIATPKLQIASTKIYILLQLTESA